MNNLEALRILEESNNNARNAAECVIEEKNFLKLSSPPFVLVSKNLKVLGGILYEIKIFTHGKSYSLLAMANCPGNASHRTEKKSERHFLTYN